MVSWPGLGTRVTVRYRRPAGSMPPLTDAVGRLLAVDPTVRVQTKTGTIVEFSPVDVVALRVLTDAPVRTAAIRALEHAAAAAWPGVERTWLDGWLLRAGHGAVLAANSLGTHEHHHRNQRMVCEPRSAAMAGRPGPLAATTGRPGR